MRRLVGRWFRAQPWWAKGVGAGVTLLVSLNLTVAWVGDTSIFPLSPFFLRTRVQALGAYLEHRVGCLGRGHPAFDAQVRRASKRHGLPPGLLEALIQVESEGRPHRISAAGAMGPGQLMPGTARGLGVDDPYDPAQAADGSARYLAQQLRRYRGNIRLALAAYNAGPGHVTTRVPRNGETEFYVRKVVAEYERTRPKQKPASNNSRSRRSSRAEPDRRRHPVAAGARGPRS